MKLSELISQAQDAKKALGDVDVVYIAEKQFLDVRSVQGMAGPNRETAWCWSGPVAVVDLDPVI